MSTSPQPPIDAPKKKMKTWVKVVIGVAAAAILAVTAGPFIYINFIKDDPPPKLSLADAPAATEDADPTAATADAPDTTESTDTDENSETTPAPETTASEPAAPDTTAAPTVAETASPAAGADGTYTVTQDSVVGYRVVEVLFGQDTEGVGRTSEVTGSIVIAGTQVTGDFTVDMATLLSDEDRRDDAFRGRIMEVDQFPTATFVITSPIELGSVPADGEEITATATGELTLHGVTNSVTLEVQAQRTGGSISIAGSTDIVFADYDIDDPSTGGISTQNHGLLEFLIVATLA